MEANRYALVDGAQLVVNVILWDGNTSTWEAPAGTTAHLLPDDSLVGPGWTFDGEGYSPPPTADDDG